MEEGYESNGKQEERRGGKERLTAAQQPPPQQDSPATQNVFPQHVDPVGMQKGAMLGEAGMQHWSVLLVNKFPSPCLPQAQLTIRVETLAAHVPRTQIICTAREDPCIAGRNIVIERRREGCEDGGVGRERVGKEGGR